jgi:hypothetical protein
MQKKKRDFGMSAAAPQMTKTLLGEPACSPMHTLPWKEMFAFFGGRL